MATKYEKQATKTLAPIYQKQQQAIQSQIPAIQQLYQTLTQGLNQNYETNLASGVQGINEDASARGVLRSTLPNDSRAALTAQLGAALQQSLGQIGAQQAGDIAGINTQIGDLGIKRVGAITDLSNTLQAQAFDRQKAKQQQKQFEQELALARERAAASVASPSIGSVTSKIGGALSGAAGSDGYVSPQAYAAAKRDWINQGLSSKKFDEVFAAYRNPYSGDTASGSNRSLADYGVI